MSGRPGFYERHVLPRLIGCACSQPVLTRLRAEVVPQARGAVFELGCGGGLNQPFYRPEQISRFVGIDPNLALLDAARAAAARRFADSAFHQTGGEAIPAADAAFDSIVCTFTLCSVTDHPRTIAEMRRVLKPHGVLLFVEHGRAPDSGVQRWQRMVEPVWKRLAGNCHLTRPIAAALADQGFSVEPMGREYIARTPRPLGWMEWGRAVRTA